MSKLFQMKYLICLILITSVYLLSYSAANAASLKFVTIINPIRGSDFFQLKDEKPIVNLKKQWAEISKRNLNVTYLLRPDSLSDQNITNFLKGLPDKVEIGIFAEITPTWTKMAGVKYREDKNWHHAGSVFLTGYEVEERKKLIDAAFEMFKEIFKFYPKSVGAWWIDAGSLSYMREKYGIVANMDVSDQYSTDDYQVWGQYFSTPFYPSKGNALVPAQGKDQKIGVVTVQWATRDPYNSYGNGVLDSTFSVQANDYANSKYHNLDTSYFERLVAIYLDNPYSQFGQVTIGLENDFAWDEYGEEFIRQLGVVVKMQRSGTQVTTMSEFAKSYSLLFPNTSPPQTIFTKNPLGGEGYVVWFQTTRYRVGWFYNNSGSVIRDLRLFYNAPDEPCLSKSCSQLNLAMIETRNLDEVTYGDRWIIDEGKISGIEVLPFNDTLKISYLNQLGNKRTLEFLPNDIKIDNFIRPLPVAINEAQNASRNQTKEDFNFNYSLENGLVKVLFDQLKDFIIFIIFVIFAFYLPGLTLLKGINISQNSKFFLSFAVGISFFTILTFIFSYLKIGWVIFLVPFISLLVIKKDWILPVFNLSKEFLLGGLVIILGSTSWLLTTIKNGLLFDYGLGFWGPHGHDAIWHLSLIESLKNSFPAQNPVFSGEILRNYHYFYDLLLAQTSIFTKLETIDLYFRFYPILISITCGVVVYILAKEWFKSSLTAFFACFFLYFGGSFGWLVSYFKDKSLGGETTFWAQQGISTLINPPFAISILLFLAGLYLFLKISSQKQYLLSLIIPLTVLWGSLIGFKAYGGVLVLLSLTVVTLYEFLKSNLSFLKISLPIFLLSTIVFLPTFIFGSSLLVFAPFWLIHSMLDSPDRLFWSRLSLARISGMEMGNWIKFIGAEGIGLAIFILGNLGTRVIGTISFLNFLKFNTFNLFIIFFLASALLLPILFIQKGTNWNIVQFFYYFLFIFNFFAAASLISLIKKIKILGWFLAVVLILFTLPTTWDTIHHYLPKRPPARVSLKELDALKFLKSQPDGVVLSFYDKRLRDKFSEPVPLFVYESTAYAGALSGKKEYIADIVNLEILGVDYKARLQAQKDILSQREPEIIKRILKEGKITYVYSPKIFNFNPDQERFGLKRIFKNEEVEIYKNIGL